MLGQELVVDGAVVVQIGVHGVGHPFDPVGDGFHDVGQKTISAGAGNQKMEPEIHLVAPGPLFPGRGHGGDDLAHFPDFGVGGPFRRPGGGPGLQLVADFHQVEQKILPAHQHRPGLGQRGLGDRFDEGPLAVPLLHEAQTFQL